MQGRNWGGGGGISSEARDLGSSDEPWQGFRGGGGGGGKATHEAPALFEIVRVFWL